MLNSLMALGNCDGLQFYMHQMIKFSWLQSATLLLHTASLPDDKNNSAHNNRQPALYSKQIQLNPLYTN